MRSIVDRNAAYRIRLLAAAVASLVVVTLCFKIPLTPSESTRPTAQPTRGAVGMMDGRYVIQGSLVIGRQSQTTIAQGAGAARPAREPVAAPDTTPAPPPVRTHKLPVLDFAEFMPAIEGGLRAYYIHIDYPEQARIRGIEGRLTLTFTVNIDGSTSDIMVTRPLHPLLDSAAVQALRTTAFIPGQHRGSARRVRMQLPVWFRLIDPPVDSTAVS